MEILSYFFQNLERNINSMSFLPVLILIDGILATYFYSVLKKRTKKVIIFIGFILSFFILFYTVAGTAAHYWGATISTSALLFISGALSVLLYFGFEFLSKLMTVIGIAIGGAIGASLILDQLGFFKHTSNMAIQSVAIVIGGIFIGGGIYALAKKFQYVIREALERVIALKISASAIGGASIIMFILMFYRRLSVMELINEAYSDKLLFHWAASGSKAVLVIVVALSGMAVQAFLVARSRRKRLVVNINKNQEMESGFDGSNDDGAN